MAALQIHIFGGPRTERLLNQIEDIKFGFKHKDFMGE